MRSPATSELLDRARALLTESGPVESRRGSVPGWLGVDAAEAPGIGRFIDHTLLKPEATRAQVLALCEEALRYQVKAVCVNGAWVGLCSERLAGSTVLVAGVVGFPLGAMESAAKASETRLAVAAGAGEVDMVLALGPAKAGEWENVADDIRCVVAAAGGSSVKVILETATLEPLEIAAACLVSGDAGAAFVKTSTGFHSAGGATLEAVSLMRRAVGPALGVKASGGIRTGEAALQMLAAGASRIGTSNTAAMAKWLGQGGKKVGDLWQKNIEC